MKVMRQLVRGPVLVDENVACPTGQVDVEHDWPARKHRRLNSQLTLDSREPAELVCMHAGEIGFDHDRSMRDGNETFNEKQTDCGSDAAPDGWFGRRS